jgi:hypothetical protein
MRIVDVGVSTGKSPAAFASISELALYLHLPIEATKLPISREDSNLRRRDFSPSDPRKRSRR